MSRTRAFQTGSGQAAQRGYTMIELSVALIIALLLLNGMFSVLQSTRKTSTNQSVLAQLQDEERVAMTMMTDIIQQAGYYPNPQTQDPTTVLVPTANFGVAGQAVAGASNAYGDTVTVRYEGDTSNNVIDCRGSVIPNGTMEEMTFSVQPGPPAGAGPLELFCTVNGVAFPLVPNVHALAVSYGVDANSSNSANTYLPWNLVASGGTDFWPSVYTVGLTVSFVNPLFGQPGQANQYIQFKRVVGIMTKAGVNVLTLY